METISMQTRRSASPTHGRWREMRTVRGLGIEPLEIKGLGLRAWLGAGSST